MADRTPSDRLAALAALVRASHERHYGKTALSERLRDLHNEVEELVHYRDDANLHEEIGDVGWTLLQLCNELGLDFGTLVEDTVKKLDQRRSGRRVCLLGLSANPFTNAHLTMALEILAITDAEEVWFYPAGEHPWGKKLMPAVHRVEMIRRAIAGYRRLKVTDFEVVHGAEIYPHTRETAEILRDYFLPAHPGVSFSWVMGSDVAQTFEKWRGSDWMAEAMRIFVIHRLGYDFDKAHSILAAAKHLYLRDNIVTSNISSSLVRERGKSYDHDKLVALVPPVVWDYLLEHRLLDPDQLT